MFGLVETTHPIFDPKVNRNRMTSIAFAIYEERNSN